MSSSAQYLNASAAAGRLGISAKALRLYEQRGLIAPIRTAAGWRTYGPEQMARAAEIVALRGLGLSLAQVAQVMKGQPQALEPALAAHQAALEGRIRALSVAITRIGELRAGLMRGEMPVTGELQGLVRPGSGLGVAFDLPWPWGGERFELSGIGAITYIVGPLGSGKTRLAQAVAANLPGAAFLGLERSNDGAAGLADDPALRARVEHALGWLLDDGATASDTLIGLLAGLESAGPGALVVDLVEQGLDQATQEALIAHLRARGDEGRPLFLMTRSAAILDLAAVGPNERIILCPANHSPPTLVAPYPGAAGYEAVATCLAPPEVRARTEGVIAWRPEVA